jgi:hypothetical protein
MSGEFLLSYASFDTKNRPFLEWQIDGKTERGDVLGQELSLAFDFSTKYCTGWVDFDNHCSQVCPDSATVDGKYENCLKCRNRTGFNPAFYNADSVSAQQKLIKTRTSSIWHISRRKLSKSASRRKSAAFGGCWSRERAWR